MFPLSPQGLLPCCFVQDNTTVQNGGNRHTTILVYLSDVEEGGETVFPLLPPAPGQDANGMSACAAEHLAVKPKKGTGKGRVVMSHDESSRSALHYQIVCHRLTQSIIQSDSCGR